MDHMDFSSIGTTYEKWNKFSARGSLMIWGAFSIKGKANLVKMERRQNA